MDMKADNLNTVTNLIESLDAEDDVINSLTGEIKELSYNSTYHDLANLTLNSPYLSGKNNGDCKSFSKEALHVLESAVPDIKQVVKNTKIASSILFLSVIGVVAALVLGYFLTFNHDVGKLLVTTGLVFSLMLMVLSTSILLYLRGIESSYNELAMQAALEQSAVTTSRYEGLRQSINELIANPEHLLDERASLDRTDLDSVRNGLNKYFQGHAA